MCVFSKNMKKLTHFLHCLQILSDPTGKGISPTILRYQSQVQVVTCASDLLAIDWKFPWCISPQVQLICSRIQESIHLLYNQFILRGNNSGIARWKRCMGQGMWKGLQSFCTLWAHHSPSTSMYSSTWELSESIPFGFLWMFYWIGMTD